MKGADFGTRAWVVGFAALAGGLALPAIAWACSNHPTVVYSPGRGEARSVFTLTGTDFVPGDVTIHWEQPTGPVVGHTSVPAGSARNNTFTTDVTVPDMAAGLYQVFAVQGATRPADTFEILSPVTAPPAVAPPHLGAPPVHQAAPPVVPPVVPTVVPPSQPSGADAVGQGTGLTPDQAARGSAATRSGARHVGLVSGQQPGGPGSQTSGDGSTPDSSTSQGSGSGHGPGPGSSVTSDLWGGFGPSNSVSRGAGLGTPPATGAASSGKTGVVLIAVELVAMVAAAAAAALLATGRRRVTARQAK